jgi:hypothetical protein
MALKNVIHVPLTSFDSVVGMSPITQAARSFGLAAAATKFGVKFFANNDGIDQERIHSSTSRNTHKQQLSNKEPPSQSPKTEKRMGALFAVNDR